MGEHTGRPRRHESARPPGRRSALGSALGGAAAPGPGGLLDHLVARVPGARGALLVSRAGLVLGASTGLAGRRAASLATAAAGLLGAAEGVRDLVPGTAAPQTLVHLGDALLLVSPVGPDVCAVLLADGRTDAAAAARRIAELGGGFRTALPAWPPPPAPRRALTPLERAEHDVIRLALAESRGNKSRAARRLGISRTTLYKRLHLLQISR